MPQNRAQKPKTIFLYMPINPQPYGTYLLAKSTSGAIINSTKLQEISKEYLAAVRTALVGTGATLKGKPNEFSPVVHSGVIISGWWFTTSIAVRWEPTLTDIKHELLLVCAYQSYVAFYASDSALRRVLLSSISNPVASVALASLSKISSGRLTAAFLENKQLKAMWLSGTHRSVQVKADSKVLSGSDLKYALDPLSDSSYLAAAARQESMGVSLRGSAVWTKPHGDLSSFAADIKQIFDALNLSGSTEAVLPVLANELHSFADVHTPFDFDVAAPEAMRQNSRRRVASLIANLYCFSLGPSTYAGSLPHAFDLTVKLWSSVANQQGDVLLHLEPKFTSNHSESVISFEVVPATTNLLPWMKEIIGYLKDNPELFRVFYGTGHTIAAGALSISRTKDVDFSDWRWLSFDSMPGHPTGMSVVISQEKPKDNDLTNIWNPDDRSLFTWFVRSLSDQLTASRMGLEPIIPRSKDVWLFCDDDAGEVADFVHVYAPIKGTPKITLVHIKGAHNDSPDREMVAGPYEVVCGQAIKNLRHLTSASLVDRIADRIFDPKRPIWDEPFSLNVAPTGNPNDFHNVLCEIDADAIYRVLIIQPHVTKRAYDLTKNKAMVNGSSLGSIQLRTLLFGARAAAAAVSAEFSVIGCA